MKEKGSMNFVVIEGLDGSGKSTQVGLLKKFLEEKGISYRYIHFPRTESPYFGELVARFLRGEFGNIDQVNPYLVAMLYAGDRNDAKELLSDWLQSGHFVLLDRYVHSNIAYQCAKLPNSEEKKKLQEWILKLEFEHFRLPKPNLNIFLDVPSKFTEKKLAANRDGNDRDYLQGQRDIHEESMDFQRNVREIYLSLASTDATFKVINCSTPEGEMLPIDAIFTRMLESIQLSCSHKLLRDFIS